MTPESFTEFNLVGMIPSGSVEKIAFFDASDLYALNRQQEALNCILFIFSDL